MTARRQSSTTSLSRYARDPIPDSSQRSLDFCNAFWGLGDGGVDVLFARMRGAGRTMEELRGFWRERAAIEDDYAKRLSKLAKLTLGRDEIGELRNSLDTLKTETESQANSHIALAQSMRRELETPATEFIARQVHHKKTIQTPVEKAFKIKQTQENFVTKAREKYKQDCMNINLYTAQSTLVQGKDLDKIHIKLDKAKQTVQQNERDYANSVRVLGDTCQKWEGDWKVFCDQCQDLEDERIEFMKDNMWTYANAVSTVCVSDDESCEKIRVTLEQLEPEKDMENFVRDYGTGSSIPDSPQFHSYASNNSAPPTRPAARPSTFARSSTRSVVQSRGNGLGPSNTFQQTEEEEAPGPNLAGLGAVGGRDSRAGSALNVTPPEPSHTPSPQTNGNLSRSQSQRQRTPQPNSLPPQQPPPNDQPPPAPNGQQSPYATRNYGQPQALPGMASSSQPFPTGAQRQQQPGPPDPLAEPIDPAAQTQLQIGNNVFNVDPNADPQVRAPGPGAVGSAVSPTGAIGDASDPLANALAKLRDPTIARRGSHIAGNGGGSMRRATAPGNGAPRNGSAAPPVGRVSPNITSASAAPGPIRRGTVNGFGSATSSPPPPTSQSSTIPNRRPAPPVIDDLNPQGQGWASSDLHAAANEAVGAHPSSVSRPTSPAASPQPYAALAQRPQQVTNSPVPVEDIVRGFGQAFPGERTNARRLSVNMAASGEPPQSTSRPATPSKEGFAGIGARGRSPSPQPFQPTGVSSPQSMSASPNRQQQLQQGQQPHMQPPSTDPRQLQRIPSPSSVGITLDPRGQVTHDALADAYRQQSAYQNQQAQQQQQIPPHIQQQQLRMQQQQQQQQAQAAQQAHQQQLHQQQLLQLQQAQQAQQSQQRQPYPPQQPSPDPRARSPGAGYYGALGLTSPGGGPPGAPQQQPLQRPRQDSYNVPPQQAQQTGYGYSQQQQGPPPPSQSPYNGPQGYGPPPHTQQQQYANGGYGQPLAGVQRQPSVQYQQPPPVQQQQSQQYANANGGLYQPQHQAGLGVSRSPSPMTQQPPPSQQPQQPQHLQQQPQQTGAPVPTEYLEDGTAVLFYVKALYDYTATIEEEFDFQTGDIIAVTLTPEDGWWSGVLLDDARRIPGRTTFPSNFVCLF